MEAIGEKDTPFSQALVASMVEYRTAGAMKKDVKHKYRACFRVLCFAIPFALAGNVLAGNSKSLGLRNKLRHIQYLREGLSNRHREASELTENLKARMAKFKSEIGSERKRSGVKTFEAALRNPRIDYNIKLIQQILAYISRLDDKISYLKTGKDELEFLSAQADDSLRIFGTLNDMEIDELLDQLNQTSRKYQPEAKKLIIIMENCTRIPAENIWNGFVKGKQESPEK